MLFVILGKSGAGKDTLFKRLKYEKIVGYTTRPKRCGEEDGREYYFVDNAKMEEMERDGKILEKRSYNTAYGIWNYFTIKDIQLEKEIVFMICSPEQYRNIKNKIGNKVISILLDMNNKERLIRVLNREKEINDCNEICRRYLTDEEDFKGIKEEADYIIDSSNCLNEDILKKIEDIVEDAKNKNKVNSSKK